MRKFAKCQGCKTSYYIVVNEGKYDDLFHQYAHKQTLFLQPIDCPKCEPSGEDERVYTTELHRCLQLNATDSQSHSSAEIVLQQYKTHTLYYKELKEVENKNKSTTSNESKTNEKGAWAKPSQAIREKPKSEKPQSQLGTIKKNSSPKPPSPVNQEYCYTCCDCEVRANWADMSECNCACYCEL